MKILIWCCLLVIMGNNCKAVTPVKIVNSYHEIIKLIEENKPRELANYISYPLKRPNPLADIKTKSQFIKYYSTLFDTSFKQKLKSYNDSVIFEHNAQYGLVGGTFSGEIWLNEDGKLTGVNNSSAQEQKLKDQITAQQKHRIYHEVNSWDNNLYVGRSKNLLIRVDDTKNGFRYTSWKNGALISAKPDLIIYKGKQEQQGTMGGWTYTFKNNEWTYVVDDVQLSNEAKNCGLFLKLYKKGVLLETLRLAEEK